MIEQLKQRPKTINQENLSHVNSWWDKVLVKNSHQVEKQLSRFKNDNLLLNTKKFKKNHIDYRDYLTFSNKLLEFWMQKEKKVVKEIKVVQKFNKMITTFGEQAGILANVQTIDQYFTTINQKDIGDKKSLAISLGNETILLLYHSYQELIVKIIGDDETIKEKLTNLYATDQVLDNKLFDPAMSLRILFKFTNLAFRSKKISKAEYSEIYFNTIFLNGFLTRFINLYNRFVFQVK